MVTIMRSERYTSAPWASEALQPVVSGLPTMPYPGAALAGPASLLNVTRMMLGAYGSRTMVSPSLVSSRRWDVGFWALELTAARTNPATRARRVEYLFMHNSIDGENSWKMAAQVSVNRLTTWLPVACFVRGVAVVSRSGTASLSI